MAVSANKLVYDFYRKFSAQHSGKSNSFKISDVVAYLNEAQEVWFENKVAAKDQNDKIRNDLRQLKETKVCLPCKEIDCDCCEVEYPENFYEQINKLAKACNKKCCPGIEKEICDISSPQGDDLQKARCDDVRKSDFKWERLIVSESQKGLTVYHDGAMEVTEFCIDYYRKPKRIEAPELVNCRDGYQDWDRKRITNNEDFEVCATFADRQITDVAVLLALRDSNDIQGVNTQLQKILQIDRLYRRV